jgi:hypothetical protein
MIHRVILIVFPGFIPSSSTLPFPGMAFTVWIIGPGDSRPPQRVQFGDIIRPHIA